MGDPTLSMGELRASLSKTLDRASTGARFRVVRGHRRQLVAAVVPPWEMPSEPAENPAAAAERIAAALCPEDGWRKSAAEDRIRGAAESILNGPREETVREALDSVIAAVREEYGE